MVNWQGLHGNLSEIGQALGQRAREQRLRTEAMHDEYQKALAIMQAKAEIEFDYRDKQHEQQLKRIDAFMKNQQAGADGGQPYGSSPAQPQPLGQPIGQVQSPQQPQSVGGFGRMPVGEDQQQWVINPNFATMGEGTPIIENPLIKQAREKRLSEEALRRDFRNDFDSIMTYGGTIGDDSIKRMNENIGFDIKSQLEAGRGIPTKDKNGNRAWRVLSEKEWAKRVSEGKFDASEIEHINTIKEEHRAWQTVSQRLEKLGLNQKSAGEIEFESINTPFGVISLPAKFNLYAQFRDPKYAAVKRDVELAFQAFRKRVTGAQASDQELARLRPVVASFKDRPDVFFETIKNAMENSSLALKDRLDVYEAAGRDVTKFREIENEMGGQQDWSVTPGGNKYKVKQR